MKLNIIIVNYNTPADTLECLVSLKQAKLPRSVKVETTVVDNGSADDSVELIKEKFPEVELIESESNLGFAGGNNLGINSALRTGPDWIMLLNSDTIVPRTFYVDLVAATKKCEFDIYSPLIYFAKGYEFHKNYHKNELGRVVWYGGGILDWDNIYGSHAHVDEVDIGQFKQCVATDFATGACIMIRSQVIEKIGLLNEKYFLYLEDLEFCQRARLAGFSVGFNPHFYLWHKVSVTAGGIGSQLNDYFITRNRLLFGGKYASSRTKFALFREALNKLMTGTVTQKHAIRDLVFHRLGKGTWLK